MKTTEMNVMLKSVVDEANESNISTKDELLQLIQAFVADDGNDANDGDDRSTALADLSERFHTFNLNDILEEYLTQIAKIVILQQTAEAQPAHHVEFETATAQDLELLGTIYREDYVKEVTADDDNGIVTEEYSIKATAATVAAAALFSEKEKEAFDKAYQNYSKIFEGFEKKLRKRDLTPLLRPETLRSTLTMKVKGEQEHRVSVLPSSTIKAPLVLNTAATAREVATTETKKEELILRLTLPSTHTTSVSSTAAGSAAPTIVGTSSTKLTPKPSLASAAAAKFSAAGRVTSPIASSSVAKGSTAGSTVATAAPATKKVGVKTTVAAPQAVSMPLATLYASAMNSFSANVPAGAGPAAATSSVLDNGFIFTSLVKKGLNHTHTGDALRTLMKELVVIGLDARAVEVEGHLAEIEANPALRLLPPTGTSSNAIGDDDTAMMTTTVASSGTGVVFPMNKQQQPIFKTLVEEEELESRKSGSRIASTAAVDCLGQVRDVLEVFDAQTSDARKTSSDTMKRRFEVTTALRFAVQALQSKSKLQVLHGTTTAVAAATTTASTAGSGGGTVSSVMASPLPSAATPVAESASKVASSTSSSVVNAEVKIGDGNPASQTSSSSKVPPVLALTQQPLTRTYDSKGSSGGGGYVPLKLSYEDVPISAGRIVNPFSSGFGESADRWDWLLAAQTTEKQTGTPAAGAALAPVSVSLSSPTSTATNHLDLDADSVNHPFIHKSSIYYGEAKLVDCIPYYGSSSNVNPDTLHDLVAAVAKVEPEPEPTIEGEDKDGPYDPMRSYREYALSLVTAINTTATTTASATESACGSNNAMWSSSPSPSAAVKTESASSVTSSRSVIKDEKDSAAAAATAASNSAGDTTSSTASAASTPIFPYADSFDFTVARAQWIMRLGFGAVVVDSVRTGERRTDTTHRGVLTAQILLGSFDGILRMKGGETNSLAAATAAANASSVWGSNYAKRRGSGAAPKKRVGFNDSWGPILVVTQRKDVACFEEGVKAVFASQRIVDPNTSSFPSSLSKSETAAYDTARGLQVVGYYGSDGDRAAIRSYLSSDDMYTPRAPCHVLVTSYEALLVDLPHFKSIFWHTLVLDQPWGLLSNDSYAELATELTGLTVRHKLLSCSSLSSSPVVVAAPAAAGGSSPTKRPASSSSPSANKSLPSSPAAKNVSSSPMSVLPDVAAVAMLLIPSIQSIVCSAFEPPSGGNKSSWRLDERSQTQLIRLLGCLTAVCDPHVPSDITDTAMSRSGELMQSLSWLYWRGVALQPTLQPTLRANPDDDVKENNDSKSPLVASDWYLEPSAYKYQFNDVQYSSRYRDAEFELELLAVFTARQEAYNKAILAANLAAIRAASAESSSAAGSEGKSATKISRQRKGTVSSDVAELEGAAADVTDAGEEPKKKRKYVWKNRPSNYAPLSAGVPDSVPAPAAPVTTVAKRKSRKSATSKSGVKGGDDGEAADMPFEGGDGDVFLFDTHDGSFDTGVGAPYVHVEVDEAGAVSSMDVGNSSTAMKRSRKRSNSIATTDDQDADDYDDDDTAAATQTKKRHAGLKPGTIPRARPGPKPKLRFASNASDGSLQVMRIGDEGVEVEINQVDEKNKFVTKKGSAWQSFIDTPGRLRFLGYHPSEQVASLAFEKAYELRARCGIVNGWPEGLKLAAGARTHVDVRSRLLNQLASGVLTEDGSQPGSRKIPAYMEDKSVIVPFSAMTKLAAIDKEKERELEVEDITDIISLLDESSLIDGLRELTLPRMAAKQGVSSWGAASNERGTPPVALSFTQLASINVTPTAPSAYAMLVGAGGLPSAIRLTTHRCVLGRARDSTVAVAGRLGGVVSSSLSKEAPSSSHKSSRDLVATNASFDAERGEEFVHINDDHSISRRHALIHWDGSTSSFQITNISKNGGSLFVDGKDLKYGESPVELSSKAVIQVGSCIFMFMLPSLARREDELDPPLVQRAHIVFALMEQYRQRMLHRHAADFSVSVPPTSDEEDEDYVGDDLPALGLLSEDTLAVVSQAGLSFTAEPGRLAGAEHSSDFILPSGLLAIEDRAITGNYRRSGLPLLASTATFTSSAYAEDEYVESIGVHIEGSAAKTKSNGRRGGCVKRALPSPTHEDAEEGGLGSSKKKRRITWTRAAYFAKTLGVKEAKPDSSDQDLAAVLIPASRGLSAKKCKAMLMEWLNQREQELIRLGIPYGDKKRGAKTKSSGGGGSGSAGGSGSVGGGGSDEGNDREKSKEKEREKEKAKDSSLDKFVTEIFKAKSLESTTSSTKSAPQAKARVPTTTTTSSSSSKSPAISAAKSNNRGVPEWKRPGGNRRRALQAVQQLLEDVEPIDVPLGSRGRRKSPSSSSLGSKSAPAFLSGVLGGGGGAVGCEANKNRITPIKSLLPNSSQYQQSSDLEEESDEEGEEDYEDGGDGEDYDDGGNESQGGDDDQESEQEEA